MAAAGHGLEGSDLGSGCLGCSPGHLLAVGASDFPLNFLYLHFFISKMGSCQNPPCGAQERTKCLGQCLAQLGAPFSLPSASLGANDLGAPSHFILVKEVPFIAVTHFTDGETHPKSQNNWHSEASNSLIWTPAPNHCSK